ncbi:hypothetical protein PG989_013742 [Apiospora arundinis]
MVSDRKTWRTADPSGLETGSWRRLVASKENASNPKGQASKVNEQPSETTWRQSKAQTSTGNWLYNIEQSDTLHVTQPDGVKLWTHPTLHNSLKLLSVYLGFDDTNRMKRALHTARAIHVARVIHVFLKSCISAAHLAQAYQEWRRCGSDAAFRAKYTVTEDAILDYIKTGTALLPQGQVQTMDNWCKPWCELLVWSLRQLSAPAGTDDPVWRTPDGQVQEYPGSIENEMKPHDKTGYKALVGLIPWTKDVKPKFVHYSKHGESGFEKYNRVFSFARRVINDTLRGPKYWESLVKFIGENGNSSDDERREHIRSLILHGPPGIVTENDGPKWMKRRSRIPSKRRHHTEEMLRETPKENARITYLVVPETQHLDGLKDLLDIKRREAHVGLEKHAVPEHHIVNVQSHGPIDLTRFDSQDEWRDDMRHTLGFNFPKAWRNIFTVAIYNGKISSPHMEDLEVLEAEKWTLVYKYDEREERFSWADAKKLLTDTQELKTVVVGHVPWRPYSLFGHSANEDDEDNGAYYPFESRRYLQSSYGCERFAPVGHNQFDDVGKSAESPAAAADDEGNGVGEHSLHD